MAGNSQLPFITGPVRMYILIRFRHRTLYISRTLVLCASSTTVPKPLLVVGSVNKDITTPLFPKPETSRHYLYLH